MSIPQRSLSLLASVMLASSSANAAAPALRPMVAPTQSLRTFSPVAGKPNVPGSSAASAAQYTIVDAQGGGTGDGQGTSILAVSNAMVSSGFYIDSSNNKHGFVRASNGAITNFDVDGPTSQTQTYWMNDIGVVVGVYIDQGTGAQNGFVRQSDGTLITFGAGTEPTDTTYVNSISDKDEAVGEYVDSNGVFHGFLFAKNSIEDFDAPGAGTGTDQGTECSDVNVAGTIAGVYIDANNVSHGFVRAKDGAFTPFDVPGAGSMAGQGTIATGENSTGAVVGHYIDASSVNHGFVRDPGGAITTFNAPGAGTNAAQGTQGSELNSKGDATGSYIDFGGALHGFERAMNGTITEYDAPGAGTGHDEGTSGSDINRRGVISGTVVDNSFIYHGYLRTH